ncbi:hypothetical protein HDU76_009782 [Blyttiomyces sp. JEL0837]|nr:hypothetical protein HDU76_009782 [Blyttiomyces sp. JEL0837]
MVPTTVTNLQWDESTNTWLLTTISPNTNDTPTTTPYTFVFLANGPLHVPKIPSFPNLSSFKGPVFHSSQWKNDIDFTNKTVAIIGTGATSVQIVPRMINDMDVKRLVVFQRSAAWVLPKTELLYPAFLKNSILGTLVQSQALSNMQKQITNPSLRESLTPKYQFGALRITPSNEYYPALTSPKSSVITDTITKFTDSGISVRDNTTGNESHIPCDIVIMATGFDYQHGLGDLQVIGRNQTNLAMQRGNTPKAFNCTMYPNFPNLFHLLGPNSGFGHFSVVYVLELQTSWSLNAIKQVYVKEKRDKVEVGVGACERFNDMIRRGLKGTVWGLGKKSWYANEKGENVALWPFSATFMGWWFSKMVRGSDFI